MKKLILLFVLSLSINVYAQKGFIYAHNWDVKYMKCFGSQASFDSVLTYLNLPNPSNVSIWNSSTDWYIGSCTPANPIAVYNTLMGVIDDLNTNVFGYSSMSNVYNDYYSTPQLAYPRQDTYSGTTNGSGNYTVTFGTTYSVTPNIQVTLTGGSNTQKYKVISISTTGFTVNIVNEALGLIFTTVSGAPLDVLITEK